MVAMELLQPAPVVEWLQLPPDLFSRLTKAVKLTAIIFPSPSSHCGQRLKSEQ
jgi:hypothetical protein